MKLFLNLFMVFTLVSSNIHAINRALYAAKESELLSDYYFTSISKERKKDKYTIGNLNENQDKNGKIVFFIQPSGVEQCGVLRYSIAENKLTLTQKKNNSNIAFQHAFFASFLGYSDGNFALSYGIGYAPRIAFIVNDDFSYNLGTHVQAILPSGSFEGIGVSMPLLVGLAYGAPSSSNTNKAMGMIFNVGLSQVLIEDSPDSIVFLGATSEIGFAFNDYMQIRLTVVSSFEDWGSTLFFSGCFGIEI
jgi:hypothetical protein